MKGKREKPIEDYRKKCYLSCVECGKIIDFDINVFNCSPAEYKYCNLSTNYHLEEKESFPLESERGLRKYLPLLPILKETFTLGEGSTPLKRTERYNRIVKVQNLLVKDEGKNPTGSFKDRKSMVNVNVALDIGVKHIYSITSGNAGVSLSLYSSCNGIKSTHFLVNPKRDLVIEERFIKIARGKVEKDLSRIKELFEFRPEENRWNCTPGFDPIGVEGYKTISWEIWEQLNREIPDVVIVPVGSAGGLFGIYKGFYELQSLGLIHNLPEIWSVEPMECPIVSSAIDMGNNRFEVDNGFFASYADHLVLNFMPSLPLVIEAIKKTDGKALNVNNREIRRSLKNIIKTEGFLPEPSSATVLAAIEKMVPDIKDKIVVAVLTGTGLKYIEEISHIAETSKEVKKLKPIQVVLKDGRKIRISEASIENMPDILSIQHEMVEEGKFSLFGHKISYEEEIAYFNRLKDDEKFFIAQLDGRATGYCVIVNYMKNIGSSPHIAEIGTFVRRDYRELGVGSHFMSLLIDFARKVGYSKMVLEVRASNTRAIKLYRKYNFKRVARLKDYYKNGMVTDDKFIMERSLSSS